MKPLRLHPPRAGAAAGAPSASPPRRRPGPLRRLLGRARLALGTLRELQRTLVEGGRWWLVPMLAVLALASLLLIAVAAVEYVAPFVYTVF